MSGSRWMGQAKVEVLGLGVLAEVGKWRGRGIFKLQRFQIGQETHITWRGRSRANTNLIFLKRGNADNEELKVNYF